MQIFKAVITAAGRDQRALPLQMVVDRDGRERSVLGVLAAEALSAGVDLVGVVVAPGDEARYAQAAGPLAERLRFIPQAEPRGYGHALLCAQDFVGGEPFLHLVGDHLYVSGDGPGCARQVVAVAQAEACAVSAVQATRESLLPYYGAVGGRRVPGRDDLYLVEAVLEKPTPTLAETRLLVPGLRAGHYLCFFGLHVLTPAVMEILARQAAAGGAAPVTLSGALSELAVREKYLAHESAARRFDVGVKYGLLTAQLALALSGVDRAEVLARVVDVLAQRELSAGPR